MTAIFLKYTCHYQLQLLSTFSSTCTGLKLNKFKLWIFNVQINITNWQRGCLTRTKLTYSLRFVTARGLARSLAAYDGGFRVLLFLSRSDVHCTRYIVIQKM